MLARDTRVYTYCCYCCRLIRQVKHAGSSAAELARTMLCVEVESTSPYDEE